mgnify:CR=1 FL=1|jgi:hypothetical protein
MAKNLKDKNEKGPGGPLVISLCLMAPSIINVILWNMLFIKRLDIITNCIIFISLPVVYGLYSLWEKFVPKRIEDNILKFCACFTIAAICGIFGSQLIELFFDELDFTLIPNLIFTLIVTSITLRLYMNLNTNKKKEENAGSDLNKYFAEKQIIVNDFGDCLTKVAEMHSLLDQDIKRLCGGVMKNGGNNELLELLQNKNSRIRNRFSGKYDEILLPHDRETIKSALEHSIILSKVEENKESLKTGLVMLDNFVDYKTLDNNLNKENPH